MKPPAGKTWLTVELDTQQVTDIACVDIWDLDQINEEVGPDPEEPADKAARLLTEAEVTFRDAASAFLDSSPMHVAPNRLALAASTLGDALAAMREAL